MVTNTHREGFSGGSVVKTTPAYAGDLWVGKILEPGSNLGLERYPGESNTTHFSILAWEIPWPEEPGRL